MPRVTPEYNLAVINPSLAREWHPTKNGTLTPSEVTPGSGKKVWWLCERGHAWEARIFNRAAGYGCPHCFHEITRKKMIEASTEKRLAKLRQRGVSPHRDAMRKLGETKDGEILVAMSPELWNELSLRHGLSADLAQRLVTYRKTHSLSQPQMAEKIGIGKSRLQLIEYGSTAISFRTYQRIISVIS
jgi:DNA-binding XRE family transcriptional regulator